MFLQELELQQNIFLCSYLIYIFALELYKRR
jgi:hypothetical protein